MNDDETYNQMGPIKQEPVGTAFCADKFFFLNLINCFISAKSPSESPEKLPTSEPNIESDEIENVLAKAKEMMNNVEPISSLSGKCIHYV